MFKIRSNCKQQFIYFNKNLRNAYKERKLNIRNQFFIIIIQIFLNYFKHFQYQYVDYYTFNIHHAIMI